MSNPGVPRVVGIVGAGAIGVGWAVVFTRGGSDVRVFEPDTVRREALTGEVHSRLRRLRTAGLLDEDPEAVCARMTSFGSVAECIGEADYVQECGPELLELKQKILSEIDEHAPEGCPVGSSSSAIPCSSMASDLIGRARFLVVHPGNPPYLIPVAELVPAPFTAPTVVAWVRGFLVDMGMAPVVLGSEAEGFVFNRIQGAVLREAYCLVRDGVINPRDLDRIVRDGLARRWSVVGPFATADLNVPGGLEAHAARMGSSYARMGAERGQDDPWTADLVRRVADDVHDLMPLSRWEESVQRRDDALMHMERARRTCPRVVDDQTDWKTTTLP